MFTKELQKHLNQSYTLFVIAIPTKSYMEFLVKWGYDRETAEVNIGNRVKTL